MAFFLPRKLLSVSNSTNTTPLDPVCAYECNESNLFGTCESPCFKICPEICKQAFEDFVKKSPPPISQFEIKKYSIISISVLASFFLLVCFMIVYRNHKRRSVSRSREQRGNVDAFLDGDRGPVVDHPVWYVRTVGLYSSIIGSIPVCRYKKGDGLVEGTECSVCLSQFEEDETLRLLPKCNHAFHVNCIDTWLRSHTNCPLCRAPIVTDPYASFSSLGLSIRTVPEEIHSGIQQEIQESENVAGETEEQSGEVDGIQQVRRPVSMDSLSASKISQAVLDRNHSGFGPPGMKEPNRKGSSSIGGESVQNEPSFLNRSVSCSAKFTLPK